MPGIVINEDRLDIRMHPQEIFDIFHCYFYLNESRHDEQFPLVYHGVPIHKNPCDLFNYQQIIFETRPDFIIECGAFQGGSTLFFAHQLDLMGHGRVVSIDICEREESWYPEVSAHPRVDTVVGSSVAPETVAMVRETVAGAGSVMVVLDSLHTRAHVLEELLAYREFVRPGNYIIVEDGNLNGHPLPPQWHPQTAAAGGPFEAVEEFLAMDGGFEQDERYPRRFLFSYAPNGYLRRKEVS